MTKKGAVQPLISLENPHSLSRGVASVTLDGVVQPDDVVLLSNDGLVH